jgi:hypothetical protein
VFHQPHPAVLSPAFFVVVPHHILVVGVGVFCEITLDEFPAFIRSELEEYVHVVNIAQVDTYRMLRLELQGFVEHELVLIEGGTRDLVGAVETHD